MDFKMTEDRVKLRQEFFDFCAGLEKERPEGFTGLEGCYDTDEGWEYHLNCAKQFAKKGWLSLGWPSGYSCPKLPVIMTYPESTSLVLTCFPQRFSRQQARR